jgi:hypothetical protein
MRYVYERALTLGCFSPGMVRVEIQTYISRDKRRFFSYKSKEPERVAGNGIQE